MDYSQITDTKKQTTKNRYKSISETISIHNEFTSAPNLWQGATAAIGERTRVKIQ